MAAASSNLPDILRPNHSWAMPLKTQIMIIFCMSLVIVFMESPWPLSILDDPDQCLQLAGAQLIAGGEHPFISFGADYGPLVFYVSYLAQQFGGHCIAAELLTDTVGYAFACTLIFINTSMITRRKWIALPIVLLAIIQLPRFYKYYILLLPSLSLLSLLNYSRRPTQARLLIVAFSSIVTTLFRPDMGVYAVIGAMLAIVVSLKSCPARFGQMGWLVGMLVVLSAPWLIFLAAHHGLAAYFRDSIVISISHSRGLANPLPRLDLNQRIFSTGNLQALAYIIWWGAPMLAVAVLSARWKHLGQQARHCAIVTICFATLCLVQSDHRSGYGHLIQAIAASYALVGWLIDQAMDLVGPMEPLIAALALGLASVTVAAGVSSHSLHLPAGNVLANYYNYYFCDRREFARRMIVKAPDSKIARLIRFIDANTNADDRIFLASYRTQLCYLCDRKPAGGQIFIAPGFFSADSDQQAIIQTLKAQHNPMVIERLIGYDGLDSRQFRSFESKVFDYVKTAYRPVVDPSLPPDYVVWRAVH